ncbi:hypothetical protein [Duganella radicis]|uniref:Uncharacterized protein n=1 Tax=Duganella radicis TaxID=551988 RepID=A0A6L6PF31_9BURK|nr:hypothetical protein [Duganella radicis]MTV37187.1 hypothetical protein [Duganella radicis]
MDLYPLRSLGFKVGGNKVLPVFSGDWFETVAPEPGGSPLLYRLYSQEAKESRDGRREMAKANLAQVVAGLEAELIAVAG